MRGNRKNARRSRARNAGSDHVPSRRHGPERRANPRAAYLFRIRRSPCPDTIGCAVISRNSWTTNLISLIQLGTVDYATGLRLQRQLLGVRKEKKIGDVLLLLEHSPVITLGRNAKAANVIASPELLAQRGVELFECDRGGDVTFHGPGQIVGYPIFDLRGFAAPDGKRKTLGVVEFVRRLEEVLIRTCADFAIAAERVAGLTGVWTNPEAAMKHVTADAFVRPSSSDLAAAGPLISS